MRSLGIDIDDLVLEPLASSEAVLTEDESQVGVVMADIGGGTTDIAVFKEGSIWHTSILPVAGYQLTRDVAIGLGLPFEVAEEMKKKYGSVMPVYENKRRYRHRLSPRTATASPTRTSATSSAPGVEEILKLILLELPSSDYESIVPPGSCSPAAVPTSRASRRSAAISSRCRSGSAFPAISSGIADSCATRLRHGVGLLLWGPSTKPKTSGSQAYSEAL